MGLPETPERTSVAERKRRPFGVSAVTLLLILLAGSIAFDAQRGQLTHLWHFPTELLDPSELRVLGYVITGVLVVIATGMWRLRRTAWVSTMLLVGSIMVAELLAYVRTAPRYQIMALCTLIVFYLNQRDVQRLFRRRRVPA